MATFEKEPGDSVTEIIAPLLTSPTIPVDFTVQQGVTNEGNDIVTLIYPVATQAEVDAVVATWPTRKAQLQAQEQIEQQLEDAVNFGNGLVASFLAGAFAGGINDIPGMANAVLTLLEPTAFALSLGSLHAALTRFDMVLATDELTRSGYPFTSDAALVPVRDSLAAQIGEDPWPMS